MPEVVPERRPVTVLFADAVGSTAFTERVGDETAYRFAQRWVAHMAEAVERNAGTLTQFRGDGVMALFGAPLAQEHSAVAAVTAALEIQLALSELSETCEFRVGLSTGPVVLGRVGGNVLLDYTAIGDTANVAARMEQAAEPGTVLISGSTWRAVREFVDCRPVGDVQAKGKTLPIPSYEALRRRPIYTSLEAAVARGLGRFVGRRQELEILLGRIERLHAGQGHVVQVTGEPGIGKSRFLLELRDRAPGTVVWSEGHCSSRAVDAPYRPMADLLRNAFHVEEYDDPEVVVARVDDATAAWPEGAKRRVPYLKYLLDVEPGSEEVDTVDARERRAGIIDALRVFVAEAANGRPHVIVVEDVHWADTSSLEALRGLADTAPQAGVLLITTSRPGYGSPFGGQGEHISRLDLEALSIEDSTTIAAGVLDVTEVPPEVATLIGARTEGNPLFVEELTATLVESGVLVAEGSRCRLTMAASDVEAPSTLLDVILARIDRLDRQARDALQLASVIGREFTIRLLERLAGRPDRLDSALSELEATELIRQTARFPELAYLFKHALTHEVTYATLLDERRSGLHRLVALAIESLYADRLAEHVEVLARHWLVAQEWDRALGYLERAADSAAATFSNDAAISFYERAITLAEQQGDLTRAVSLFQRLGDIHLAGGELMVAADVFDRMATLARRADDADALAWALGYRGMAICYNHDFPRGEGELLSALDVEGASEVPLLFAATCLRTMRAIFGRHAESAELTPMVEELAAHGVDHPRVIALGAVGSLLPRWRGDATACLEAVAGAPPNITDLLHTQTILWIRGMAQGDIGRYDDALTTLGQMITRSSDAGEIMFKARALNTVGWIRGDLGDRAGCIAWNERCLAFLRSVEMPDEEIESNARLNLAESHLAVGDLTAAALELDRVEEILEGRSVRDTWMFWRFSQRALLLTASLRLARGDVTSIGSRIDDCVALASASQSIKYLGKAAQLRGRVLLTQREIDGAFEQAERALEIANDIAYPPDTWRAAALLAEIAGLCGDRDRARFHLHTADELLANVEESLVDPGCLAGVRQLRVSLGGSNLRETH